MFEYLKKVGGQIGEFFQNLSPEKKFGLVVIGVAVLIGTGALFQWAGQQTYQTLMTNLSQEDSANIMRILREKRIPFKLDPSGKGIEVPIERVFDLRLELATMGLPESSIIGYEVFDKQSLGTTSFVQKINQKRAMEGEIMRTINAIKGVKRSRVHVAQPPKSAFLEEQKKTTASIVVDLEPGIRLSEKQVFGIGTLVASAVEGLDLADVVVMDSMGKVLSKNVRDPVVAMTASQTDYKRRLEEDFEKRIESLLTPIVGEGKVVAQVSAEVDFSRVDETQTTYDADGAAIRSSQKLDDTMGSTRSAPMGAPGVATNTPGEQPATPPGTRTDTKKLNEVTNYSVPQTVRKVIKPTGMLTKLSVAVILDGKQVKEKDANGQVLSKVQPWTPEKIKEFQDVVASAVGFDSKRGDKIEIRNMEFEKEDFETAERILRDAETRNYVKNLVSFAVIALIAGLFFWLVVRPFVKWVTENTIDSVDTFLPQTIEELEKLQKNQTLTQLEEAVPVLPETIDPEKVEGEMIKEKIVSMVDSNPHKAALVLRDWIRSKAADKGEDKAAGGGKGKAG